MTKKKKFTEREYLKLRKALKAKLQKVADATNKKDNALANKFIKDNSPIKNGKVYKVVTGKKKRGYSRIIIERQIVQWFDNKSIIVAGGHWINNITGIADKWDGSVIVHGVGNPTILALSEDQKYTSLEGK